MKINLNIDRLVLQGLSLSKHEQKLVGAAVRTELTRLLTEGGMASALSTGGSLARVPAQPIKITKDVKPGALGRQIARSIHGGIGK